MFTFLIVIHILVSLVLILVVLLQSGKAGDLASAFGGMSSQTAFGARGAATFLTKATAVCAVVFMITSLALAILWTREHSTVLENVPVTEEAPATQPQQPSQPQQQESSPPAQPMSESPPAQNQ